MPHGRVDLDRSSILQQAVIGPVIVTRIGFEIVNCRPIIREKRPTVRSPGKRFAIEVRNTFVVSVVVMVTKPIGAAFGQNPDLARTDVFASALEKQSATAGKHADVI